MIRGRNCRARPAKRPEVLARDDILGAIGASDEHVAADAGSRVSSAGSVRCITFIERWGSLAPRCCWPRLPKPRVKAMGRTTTRRKISATPRRRTAWGALAARTPGVTATTAGHRAGYRG